MARLDALGFHCNHDPETPQAPIAIINTCGFIGDAKEESINTILRFAARKHPSHNSQLHSTRNSQPSTTLNLLIVMGCLSERYLHELETEIPEVDAWFGKFDYLKALAVVLAYYKPNITLTLVPPCNDPAPRHLTTPSHYAYLKISEGCNRFCSYCAIPLITGRHTSRPMEELIAETQWLASKGVKELNIIAQDLSSYGLDLYKEHRLPQLVEALCRINGIEWIRLHYAYPADFPEELLNVMAREPKVCKYLDLAVQHCTDHMLTQMRRHLTKQEQDNLLAHIRETVPGIVIRTTVMVGHPGETEEDVNELIAWIKQQRFERLGAFAYSDEEGTYAHNHYGDPIPDKVKQTRLSRVMTAQQRISDNWTHAQIGTTQKVIIDRLEDEYYIGRTQYDSPEVDCEVLIKASSPLTIGQFYSVRIDDAEEFDLYGTII